MSSVFLGIKTDQLREIIEDVDAKAEEKVQQILNETLEKAIYAKRSYDNVDNLYFIANRMALAAYQSFQEWSAKTFTVSPAKELAIAWTNACYYRFSGAKSVQKAIREILSK